MIGFWVLALGWLSVGIWYSCSSLLQIRRGIGAIATCTHVEVRKDGKRTHFDYHLTFGTEQGEEKVVIHDVGFRSLREGGTIEILYNPENPRQIIVAKPDTMWILPNVPLIVGLLLLGLMSFVTCRPPRKKATK